MSSEDPLDPKPPAEGQVFETPEDGQPDEQLPVAEAVSWEDSVPVAEAIPLDESFPYADVIVLDESIPIAEEIQPSPVVVLAEPDSSPREAVELIPPIAGQVAGPSNADSASGRRRGGLLRAFLVGVVILGLCFLMTYFGVSAGKELAQLFGAFIEGEPTQPPVTSEPSPDSFVIPRQFGPEPPLGTVGDTPGMPRWDSTGVWGLNPASASDDSTNSPRPTETIAPSSGAPTAPSRSLVLVDDEPLVYGYRVSYKNSQGELIRSGRLSLVPERLNQDSATEPYTVQDPRSSSSMSAAWRFDYIDNSRLDETSGRALAPMALLRHEGELFLGLTGETMLNAKTDDNGRVSDDDDYLMFGMLPPARFAFVDVENSPIDGRWEINDSQWIGTRFLPSGRDIPRPSFLPRSSVLSRPTTDVRGFSPSRMAREPHSRVQVVGWREGKIILSNDEYRIVGFSVTLHQQGGGFARFETTGEEILTLDSATNQIVYRRFRGTTRFPECELPPVSIDYELWVGDTDTGRVPGLLAAMNLERLRELSIARNSDMPVARIRAIESGEPALHPTISPNGRWLTEYFGAGLRIRDLDQPNSPIVMFLEGGDGFTAWDETSSAFARIRVSPNRDDAALIEIVDVSTEEPRIARHLLPDLSGRSLKAVAINLEAEQLLVFQAQEVHCFDLAEEPQSLWRHQSQSPSNPLSVAWTGDQIAVQFDDRLVSFDQTSGLASTAVEFQPTAMENDGTDPIGFWRGYTTDQGSLTWNYEPPLAVAYETSDGKRLADVDLGRLTDGISIASEANLMFVLADGTLSIYDLTGLTRLGRWPLPSEVRRADEIHVSADARRLLLYRKVETSSRIHRACYLLDLEVP